MNSDSEMTDSSRETPAGRYAAHRDLALAGPQVLDREAGDVGRDVLDALGAAVAERLLRGRDHREGHRLEVLLALARGDRDRDFLGEVRWLDRFHLGRVGLLCGSTEIDSVTAV